MAEPKANGEWAQFSHRSSSWMTNPWTPWTQAGIQVWDTVIEMFRSCCGRTVGCVYGPPQQGPRVAGEKMVRRPQPGSSERPCGCAAARPRTGSATLQAGHARSSSRSPHVRSHASVVCVFGTNDVVYGDRGNLPEHAPDMTPFGIGRHALTWHILGNREIAGQNQHIPLPTYFV